MPGVYIIVAFFFLSVYINKYKNRGRGKENSNLNVSTFTLFAHIYMSPLSKTLTLVCGNQQLPSHKNVT